MYHLFHMLAVVLIPFIRCTVFFKWVVVAVAEVPSRCLFLMVCSFCRVFLHRRLPLAVFSCVGWVCCANRASRKQGDKAEK